MRWSGDSHPIFSPVLFDPCPDAHFHPVVSPILTKLIGSGPGKEGFPLFRILTTDFAPLARVGVQEGEGVWGGMKDQLLVGKLTKSHKPGSSNGSLETATFRNPTVTPTHFLLSLPPTRHLLLLLRNSHTVSSRRTTSCLSSSHS